MSIWNTALNILSRREHSRFELGRKLRIRFPDQDDDIETVLVGLVDRDLQSDARFVELWLTMQINRARGPIRIRYEARTKGVEQLIEAALTERQIDWFEQALSCARRKLPSGIADEQRAKAYRFLAYRGFEADAIHYALTELRVGHGRNSAFEG
ncbi:regulatory protein RecX [Reinekea sp.]|uniref:regulatory protein RecX n=1 Tax=Reinekea sp. TaxID=1970455 RepID=UPI002A8302E9|nr:regulatory protein RecX [Reinekea sp.]